MNDLLVICDSKEVQGLIQKQLGNCEFKPLFVKLDAIETIDQKFNLVLIASEEDPYVICRTLRESSAFKKIIKKNGTLFIIDREDNIDHRVLGFQAGAQDLININNPGELCQKVKSVLRPGKAWEGVNAVVVDDEIISAKFISHVIKSKGAKSKVFQNALEALEYIKENPEVDLILTDHMMPEMSGIEFVKKIRGEYGLKTIPIIFISALQDSSEVLKFYKAGGNDYISKPLIKEELFIKVDQILKLRRQSKMLLKQVKELEELDRLKDQFLAVASHDLRSPLNVILGLSDLLEKDSEFNDDVHEMGKQIHNSGKQVLDMVEELLELSEVQLGKANAQLQIVSISDILKDCLYKIEMANDKHIQFINETQGQILANINSGLIVRLITNLLSNAYKFTPKNGVVRSSITRDQDQDKIILKIQDTGIGIPEEFKEKLFERMSGVGRKGTEGERSVGLGLSIVKDIADKHNAEIKVVSEENVGTTFYILFNDLANDEREAS
ncbi:response regulator [Halobacteriovorax sp. GB3]|uniref:response regulator n=1 Tax=Halobacteriovorax sp. GB3 TaxID=2719615 RepID=UPI002361CF0A|nr:response regulator [Halobacteriovorax sp. GB3]MDD0853491.1 response regulator [Halobacteriovorax sp. GB3]